LAASAIWIGGLLLLTVVLVSFGYAQHGKRESLQVLVRRFSGQALLCVALLLATGVYNAWLHLSSWSSFLDTNYGRLLLLKMALLVPLLIAAGINRLWFLPKLAAAEPPEGLGMTLNWLRRLVRTETALGVILLGVAAVLTQLPPATSASGMAPAILDKPSGDFVISLKVSPQRSGSNRATAWIRTKDGVLVSDARRVTFFLNMLDMDMGLQTVQASPAADGSYSAEVVLSMAGRWRISVEASPPRGDTFVTEFEFLATAPERSRGNP
jgi:copper transport protein